MVTLSLWMMASSDVNYDGRCIHKCLSTSCQCIIAVGMPMASSLSVCHNTGISGSSLFFSGGGGGVGSDYMCTGHAV